MQIAAIKKLFCYCFGDEAPIRHSIANSNLFPTSMYVCGIFSPKKCFFWNKNFFQKIFFLHFFYATFHCERYSVFKKELKEFFDPEKVKKRASKVAPNRPRPFYRTVQPRPQPTVQNWFSISWNLGTRHLFSYLWHTYVADRKLFFIFRKWRTNLSDVGLWKRTRWYSDFAKTFQTTRWRIFSRLHPIR